MKTRQKQPSNLTWEVKSFQIPANNKNNNHVSVAIGYTSVNDGVITNLRSGIELVYGDDDDDDDDGDGDGDDDDDGDDEDYDGCDDDDDGGDYPGYDCDDDDDDGCEPTSWEMWWHPLRNLHSSFNHRKLILVS